MINKSEVEQKVAESLLQIKAIKLQPNNPFIVITALPYLTHLSERISGKI
jgi:orotate phosphoribosyltransferase